MALPTLTRAETVAIFRSNIVDNYVRKPMHDFQYLESSIVPTTTEWAVSMIIGIIVAIGLVIFFQKVDMFGDEYKSYQRRKYGF